MLQIDADLPPERVTLETADLISSLAPFGAGNEIPQLRVRGVAVDSYSAVGQDGTHLKLHLATPGGEVSAISWGAADRSKELVSGRWLDLVATLGVDHWNGRRRLQVEIKDFRVAT
jgi:single-stranded-DNA-specific exonuclease